jgi:MSHA biogenesis protein MshK
MAGRMIQMTEDITNDLVGVVCQPSQMASSSIRGQRTEVLSRCSRAVNNRAAQRRTNICLLSSVFCCLLSVFCYAEDLPDPTRPPASIFAPVAGAGREATENQSSGLHSIIISETRRAAIIDGKIVELGGEHGDARLIEVNEGGVVLQRAQSRQVLTLFPDVKIARRETPDKESAEKESPNQESQVKQPSSASKAQSGKHKAKPTAHYEKLLSGHPKEEK